MFSARLLMRMIRLLSLLMGLIILSACDGMTDDLFPSGEDKRPDVDTGIEGIAVGQQSPDFSMYDTLGNSRGLYAELARPIDGVVLYFNMWCPICDSHASHMRANVMPQFPDVQFFLVDYVSGSISVSRDAQLANGYGDIETLVDIGQVVFDMYQASMGTTIVVDRNGIIQMSEDYKDGVKLTEIANYPNLDCDRSGLAKIGADAYLEMIFADGFFHADPHPGNLMVLPGPNLVFLDFGAVAEISPNMREGMIDEVGNVDAKIRLAWTPSGPPAATGAVERARANRPLPARKPRLRPPRPSSAASRSPTSSPSPICQSAWDLNPPRSSRPSWAWASSPPSTRPSTATPRRS